ncbi:LAMI_0F07514g1_1 [Lachancea mirantina]|uniref:LAMI_0F07514g1_1 n=1 Tax=Lachancea mirantina TaxID=1230905 RepID=A0A1G4JZR6_9SACH|nr:LAMI_0F07514g1_1 [Lachancea mirantina]
MLTPSEEHHLKTELIKLQLFHEFSLLDDVNALRKFGYPFSNGDPQKTDSTATPIGRILSPSKKRLSGAASIKSEPDNDQIDTQFPILSHFLKHFVVSLPLLSQDLAGNQEFWQKRVQVFFEHFMSMNFSTSFDREELTKRRRMSLKLSKMILLMYNAGIGCAQETQYYAEDKSSAGGGQESLQKASKLDKFTMPSKDNLRFLLTNQPIYINGWDINVISASADPQGYGLEPKKVSKPATPKWMRSAFGFSPTTFASPSKLLSKLTVSDSTSASSNFYFLIRLKREGREGETYIAKEFSDFKNLVQDLKKEFPAKTLPRLPHKSKAGALAPVNVASQGFSQNSAVPVTPKEQIVSSFTNEESYNDDQTKRQEKASLLSPTMSSDSDSQNASENWDDGGDTYEEPDDSVKVGSTVLVREKMRTSLRQYLRSLCDDDETAGSISLSKFLGKNELSPDSFTKAVLEDVKQREAIDFLKLEHQIAFQKLALEKSLKLQASMKSFRQSLLENEGYLVEMFQELKEKPAVKDLSPMLQSFFEWCKVNVSATIYQMFLGNDSGYEFYTQIRKLHKLMPYTVMIQILRFTNPMAIMKGLIDLFMARPFGGNSLLQTMFSSVLSDDLRSQLKVAEGLETAIEKESTFGTEVAKLLAEVIFNNENGEIVNMSTIHEDAQSMSMPMALVIVMKCAETSKVSQQALDELIESYSAWKQNNDSSESELKPQPSNVSVGQFPGLYFSHVKDLLQTYIRERDKMLMKKIWQDPQLTQLLKSTLALFYEPLVRIFRVSRMDNAFKNFEKFMTDLVALMDVVIDGQENHMTSLNVVDAINKLVDKHEASFYEFVHDVCIHDTENIFQGFITYFTNIVKFLQNSKYQTTDRIDLAGWVENSSDKGINVDLLKKQLDTLIEHKRQCREAYQSLIQIRTREEKLSGVNIETVMKKSWEESNAGVFSNGDMALGFKERDLVDLDLDTKDYTRLNDAEEKFQQDYHDLLEKRLDLSEIGNFNDKVFSFKLKELLR